MDTTACATEYVGVCGRVFLATRPDEPIMAWRDGGWHIVCMTLRELAILFPSNTLSVEEAGSLMTESTRT